MLGLKHSRSWILDLFEEPDIRVRSRISDMPEEPDIRVKTHEELDFRPARRAGHYG